MAQTAYYSLADVTRHLNEGKFVFSAPGKSLYSVIDVYSRTTSPKSIQEAQDFIVAGLKSLTANDFCYRIKKDDLMDVYGIIYDGRPWFVKFYIDDEVLDDLSFHPPDKPLQTVTGKLIG